MPVFCCCLEQGGDWSVTENSLKYDWKWMELDDLQHKVAATGSRDVELTVVADTSVWMELPWSIYIVQLLDLLHFLTLHLWHRFCVCVFDDLLSPALQWELHCTQLGWIGFNTSRRILGWLEYCSRILQRREEAIRSFTIHKGGGEAGCCRGLHCRF